MRCLLLLALLAAGCGYTSSSQPSGSFYRSDIRTVAVPPFGTRSFARGDELLLTQALVAQVESRTGWKVVPRDRADAVLEGEVVDVKLSRVSRDRNTSLPQEALYALVVDFRLTDLRSGQVLLDRQNFEQADAYYPTLGEGRGHAKQQGAERTAAAIVSELGSDW